MSAPIRVLFMGTPDFAVPSLRALATAKGIEVVGVVTQPDKLVGRKRVLTHTPVKRCAQELGLPVMQPVKVRGEDALADIRALRPDVIITAAYGQLLPQDLLDIPTRGCLNVHASLLPRWRGAAPIHRALMAGDEETGVTIMEMVLALDAGPIVTLNSTPIDGMDDVGTLHERLADIGARALVNVLPAYVRGEVTPIVQAQTGITYADRIRREDEFIDWMRSVAEVERHVRGLTPWPGACTRWDASVMKIWKAAIPSSHITDVAPLGTVQHIAPVGVVVRCADGWLHLLEVQPGGKRRMDALEWFRGAKSGEVRFTPAAPSE
jgi:methionyl-tRNA formyltransferase